MPLVYTTRSPQPLARARNLSVTQRLILDRKRISQPHHRAAATPLRPAKTPPKRLSSEPSYNQQFPSEILVNTASQPRLLPSPNPGRERREGPELPKQTFRRGRPRKRLRLRGLPRGRLRGNSGPSPRFVHVSISTFHPGRRRLRLRRWPPRWWCPWARRRRWPR